MLRKILKTFSKKEIFVLISCLGILLISGLILGIEMVSRITNLLPGYGGEYTEGIVGQPSFINPVLSKKGTADKELSSIIFANAIEISESIKNSQDFKEWTLRIKEGAKWQDGTIITSDDFLFTIERIKNPDSMSPLFGDWQNVTASRISELELKFTLSSPYSLFLNILKDLRPIPKKIFADISPSNLKMSSYNLKPFGSGPFIFESSKKRKDGFIEEISLKKNTFFKTIDNDPYINKITIKFFENEDLLIKGYNIGSIEGFGADSFKSIEKVRVNSNIKEVDQFKYYALFFNQNANGNLLSLDIRKALSLFTDKDNIIKNALGGKAEISYGPISNASEFYNKDIKEDQIYNPEKGREALKNSGWQFDDSSKTWKISTKNGTKELSFIIKSPDSSPLKEIAQTIRDNWESNGVKTEVKLIDPKEINENVIKTRDYEILLLGNVSSENPDLTSFWHSSEKFYPGLNLSLFEDKNVDSAITLLKKDSEDKEERKRLFSLIQEKISKNYPAIFIAFPKYFYINNKNIPGIDIGPISLPENRFDDIKEWYVKTKRVLK